jgi:hypothetical protein
VANLVAWLHMHIVIETTWTVNWSPCFKKQAFVSVCFGKIKKKRKAIFQTCPDIQSLQIGAQHHHSPQNYLPFH